MIIGHGIDLQDVSAIQKVYAKNNSFLNRILTNQEEAVFQQLKGKRQIEYLAGRWAAKEAFAKALGTGIGKITFQDIEVLNNAKGAPYVSKAPFDGKIFISISHSGHFVQASVILED
ncbi:holo-ACP synthase [Streptococcus sp. CSL10205-OR2]|uniref:holo-ACP synthase n=1 Tax=Streptococcus sp. CSL10205-OR2 TaxID=2980558 RepID=UPI0021DA477B|nr:holo-ACP synthase [Streptococcus sp. CSL10205-OR2]MCU9533968.1 holo-ACP synthase [Streptococcus sp. CSL10205-OR2]